MDSKRNIKWPIIITFIVLIVIVCLFANIEQTEVACEKIRTFDDIVLKENVITTLEGKRIKGIVVTKTILLPDRYANDTSLKLIENRLKDTLEYLKDKVSYTISTDRVIVSINVHKDEVLLLNNISFTTRNGLEIFVNSNTKSSEVITLTIGDSYTDGEFMKYMKNEGYSCQ